MRTKALQLTAIAAIAACGTAFAQGIPPPGGSTSKMPAPSSSSTESAAAVSPEFSKLDKDKDGMISKKEAAANKDLAAKFDSLDTNKDGKLDPAEFARYEEQSSSQGSTKQP